MEPKGLLVASFSVMFLFCLQSPSAHPIDSLSPAKELASMEALLERLEEKVSLMEQLRNAPGPEEAEPQSVGLEALSADGVEPGDDSAPFLSDRGALLKRMRGLQVAKSMRESGCFGRRLDRIGAVSGMGCKGIRRH
ncbi:natriuretic peptides A-like [Varanus komodoensis]|uniref:Natriuretic peptide B n=1 Tax=Varanus komodoensis TaxID=61221 RepID=A0A8D2INV6_VARKO|nr:natriuretic peptides A-like [Varanus komodoensis]